MASGLPTHTIETAIAEVRASECCVGDIDPAQIATAKDGTGEISAIEICVNEIASLKDALREMRHAKECEVELALLKQHAPALRFAACSTGETGGEEFDTFERSACHIDVGEIGLFDAYIAQTQALRLGIGERDGAPDATFDGCGLPAWTRERRQCHLRCQRIVNRTRCELFGEVLGEQGFVDARGDAALWLGGHRSMVYGLGFNGCRTDPNIHNRLVLPDHRCLDIVGPIHGLSSLESEKGIR